MKNDTVNLLNILNSIDNAKEVLLKEALKEI